MVSKIRLKKKKNECKDFIHPRPYIPPDIECNNF